LSTQATGISDKGEIVGAFFVNVGQHGFFADVPKP